MTRIDQLRDVCHRSVGEAVAEDYRRADVFKRFGIDFCCGGDRIVADACAEKGIACEEMLEALIEAEAAPLAEASTPAHVDVRSWSPAFLTSYIVNVHHQYVRERIPVLRELTQTVARVHGETNPEAVQIARLFDDLAHELGEHTDREEVELFPYIARLCDRFEQDTGAADPDPVRVPETVSELMGDHDHAGALLREIRSLSRDFTLPANACTTYRMTYAGLEEFETDLHRHVHLENNVLFPAVRRMHEEQIVAK